MRLLGHSFFLHGVEAAHRWQRPSAPLSVPLDSILVCLCALPPAPPAAMNELTWREVMFWEKLHADACSRACAAPASALHNGDWCFGPCVRCNRALGGE